MIAMQFRQMLSEGFEMDLVCYGFWFLQEYAVMQLHWPNSSISVKSDKPYFLVSFIVALVTPLSVFYKTLEKRFCAAYSIGH